MSAEPTPTSLEPHRWRPWHSTDGAAELARYVAWRGLRESLTLTWEEGVRDEQRAKDLYQLLASHSIHAAPEPRVARFGAQEVRHPALLLAGRAGSCLDIAAMYAAMCLNVQVGAVLAVIEGHVFVVVEPERLSMERHPDEPLPLGLETAVDERKGVLQGNPAVLNRAIDDGTLIAIDVIGATAGASWTEALAAGLAYVQRPDLVLVDVPYLHDDGFAPFAPPADRPSIPLYVPADDKPFHVFPSHREILEQLRGATGTVVLWGARGQGKSRLARHLAEHEPHGAAWFLDASEPQALIKSYADADRAARDATTLSRARLDREGYADNARALLGEVTDPWVVVLDNADGDPGKLRHLMPRPNERQLVLVTSTREEWEAYGDVTFIRLPRIDPTEFDAATGVDTQPLHDQSDGLLLLLTAFAALMRATGSDAATVASHARPAPSAAPPSDVDGGAPGAATLWAALRAAKAFGDRELALSAYSAYLPREHQRLDTLEALVPDAAAAVGVLVDHGLLTLDGAGASTSARIHGLFAAAIRADLETNAPELGDLVVSRLASEPAPYELLDVYGDLETVTQIESRLMALASRAAEPSLTLGTALHGIARLLELHAQTRRSTQAYERAQEHLGDSDPSMLADCLQGRARIVNQHHTKVKDVELLRDAVAWAQEARQILIKAEGENANADRCLAMEGLLKLKLAKHPAPGESTLELQLEALRIVEEADERRADRRDVDRAELARSRFNLAGPRVSIAQEQPHEAARLLNEAEEIYEDVRRRRQRLYRRLVHPHIAACEIGLGYVNYYRAMLVPSSRAQRTVWLREATDRTVLALKQREALEGIHDLDEVSKVARFLTKVALARQVSPLAPVESVRATASEATRELERAQLVLTTLPPLPSTPLGLPDAIDAWARSPALQQLTSQFEGAIAFDQEIGPLLTQLDEFSTMWDYRAGQERNLVTAPRFDTLTEKVIEAAAVSLRLDGEASSLPPLDQAPPKHYDHVLILGGLVRACLARPLHAARLLRERQITATQVTALGGYRPTRGDEIGLVERVLEEQVDDEFHAMDAGVRNAFGVSDATAERGESSDVVGSSWRVREYRTADGIPVSVVAAPSTEPGVRRANTADTYAWFATELAELHPGQRVLLVTTDIYGPYQHADGLRMLALPYGVAVDVAVAKPGDVDRRLHQAFEPHSYLQEIRSTIRSLRNLEMVAVDAART
jgi:hypothetical protein